MTNPFNLIHQIQRVLNRHSEDPYFGNLVSALQNASSNSDIDDVIYETADSLSRAIMQNSRSGSLSMLMKSMIA